MRESIPEFELLLPQHIPTAAALDIGLSAELRGECLEWSLGTQAMSNEALAERLGQLLVRWPAAEDRTGVGPADPEDHAHDNYFRIKRVAVDPPLVFLRTILHARWLLLQDIVDSPFNLDRERLDCVDRSLADLLGSVLGVPGEAGPRVSSWETTGAKTNVMLRWIRGHQIFAVQVQGLIYAFAWLERAVRAGIESGIVAALNLATVLLEGSGAAFAYTADFCPHAYNHLIRPTMMPPLAPLALSGLMSLDHRYLVRRMRDLRPAFLSLRESHPEELTQLTDALQGVYDAHKLVCSHFVGAKPSIVRDAESEKSGVAQLEQFKRLRMKVFEPGTGRRECSGDSSSGTGRGHESG